MNTLLAASLAMTLLIALAADGCSQTGSTRPRLREAGLSVGALAPGKLNAITDVDGVRVGHVDVVTGDDVRTGVTAILPHGDNVFLQKVPAAAHVGNGFGKLLGALQVRELGEIETPILLTNTLNVWRAADALVTWMLARDGMDSVRSINPVVGETNDGGLNDIRGRHVDAKHVTKALEGARGGAVAEGCVGAGVGTVCFGYKGGIGTSSRVVSERAGGWTVGVLVQSNFGGDLHVAGVPVGRKLREKPGKKDDQDGSCMIVIATDAPVDSRNLERMAKRAPLGLARTGGFMSNGSGDFVIAFSTHTGCRRPHGERGVARRETLPNSQMSPLFQAVVEATEEAVLNSLFRATTTKGRGGRTVKALPVDRVVKLVQRR